MVAARAPAWRYELVAHGGQPLAEITPRGRGLTLDLTAAGAARFSLSAAEAAGLRDLMQPGLCDILVSEGDTPRFRGEFTGAQGSDLTVTAGTIQFAAVGIAELLADRYIPAGREIAATEQTAMAWQLVADTQALPNGDLGILQGSLPDSIARTKQWDTATPVLSGLREIAGLDGGFEWDITPNADGRYVFDAFYPRRGFASGVVLDSRNVAAASPTWDAGAGALCNYASVTGVDGVAVVAEDTGSQIAYRRRERSIALSDADDVTILGDRAAAEVRDAVVRPSASLRMLPGADTASLAELGLGDIVTVEFDAGWARLTGDYRILRLDLAIPDGGGAETITATVEPWLGA